MFGVSPKSPPPHPLRFLQEMKAIEWKGSERHEMTAEAQEAAGSLNLAL